MGRNKKNVLICFLLIIALLISLVNSSFGRYTYVSSSDAYNINVVGNMFTARLVPGTGVTYDGILERVVEYGGEFDWGKIPYKDRINYDTTVTENVAKEQEAINSDKAFVGWDFHSWGDNQWVYSPKDVYMGPIHNPLDGSEFEDKYYTAKLVNFYTPGELSYGYLKQTTASLSSFGKILRLTYNGNDTDPFCHFYFDVDNNTEFKSKDYPYCIITHKYSDNSKFVNNANNPCVMLFRTDGETTNKQNVNYNIANGLNSFVFYNPMTEDSYKFQLRFDYMRTDSNDIDRSNFLGEYIDIYAIAFAKTEEQANTLAAALTEKFKRYNNSSNNILTDTFN